MKKKVKKEEGINSFWIVFMGIGCLIIGVSYLISILSDFSISEFEEIWTSSINFEPAFIFIFGMIFAGIGAIVFGLTKNRKK